MELMKEISFTLYYVICLYFITEIFVSTPSLPAPSLKSLVEEFIIE